MSILPATLTLRQALQAAEADILLWLGEGGAKPDHPKLIQVASKCDLGTSGSGLSVSAVTGEGLDRLKRRIAAEAGPIIPAATHVALNGREAGLLSEVGAALRRAVALSDPVLAAEELRDARTALDRISGRAGIEELLDALFGRFCLGK